VGFHLLASGWVPQEEEEDRAEGSKKTINHGSFHPSHCPFIPHIFFLIKS
jgi:hypothetical protein